VAQVDPDQPAALCLPPIAFGFVEVLKIVDTARLGTSHSNQVQQDELVDNEDWEVVTSSSNRTSRLNGGSARG
jgi:hypothetical protein